MKTLVKFIAIKNKREITDYYLYLEQKIKMLEADGIVKNVEIETADEDEGNVYLITFVDEGQVIERNWSLFAEFGTYLEEKQLEISICSDSYEPSIDVTYLEDLKLKFKNHIRADWEQIVWLYDEDAEVLSVDLYSRFYKLENTIRRFINEFMFKSYGVKWWERFASKDIKDKYDGRMTGYKTVVEGFKNIDDHLMSIDVGDLFKIITLEKKKWDAKSDAGIEELLSGKTEGLERRIVELLKKQLVVEIDLWSAHFSGYFEESFKEVFGKFEKNRNHVAHNKMLDRAAYKSIYKSIQDMDMCMKQALEKLNQTLMSAESRAELIRKQREEIEEYEAYLKEIKENDANVSIRTSFEIMQEFETVFIETYSDIVEAFRFREDIEVSELNFDVNETDGILFIVSSKVTGEKLEICYSADIDESEGASSTITITSNQDPFKDEEIDFVKKFVVVIEYRNGEVEYNDDQCYYMPITEDGISKYDINKFLEETVDFISNNLENLKEYADGQRYSSAKSGDLSPVAEDLYCDECGEEYICIDESIAPIGKCLNCGAQNSIAECERCGNFFIDYGEEEVKICESCEAYYEEE